MSEDNCIGWAIIELMGHRKLAGYVQEAEVAGAKMLRLDVPAEPEAGQEAVTQFYSAAAVYCLTPTTEAIARAVARNQSPTPVHRFELPGLPSPSVAANRAGPSSTVYDDEEDVYDDDE